MRKFPNSGTPDFNSGCRRMPRKAAMRLTLPASTAGYAEDSCLPLHSLSHTDMMIDSKGNSCLFHEIARVAVTPAHLHQASDWHEVNIGPCITWFSCQQARSFLVLSDSLVASDLVLSSTGNPLLPTSCEKTISGPQQRASRRRRS